MAPRTSAALLVFRLDREAGLQVFLGHMGGPYWAHREDGGWSIPKGEYDPTREEPAMAARREFAEEIGTSAPPGPQLDLGEHLQPSGKRIRAFAVEARASLQFVASNTFPLEWPRGSGRVQEFPEIDRAEWFDLTTARARIVPGQVPILEALAETLRPPA